MPEPATTGYSAHNDAAQISTGSSDMVFRPDPDRFHVDRAPVRLADLGHDSFEQERPVAIVGNLLTGKASTHINAEKSRQGDENRNILAQTIRDKVTKGTHQVTTVGNKVAAVS